MNHLNEMKNLAGKLSLVFALLCALVVQSCKDDDEDPDPVAVEFSTGNISIQETAAPQTITVSLGKAAFRDGSLSISVSPQNASEVLTIPAAVPITKGNTAVQFNVTPVNNVAVNSIQEVTITLSSVGDGFILGTKKEIKISVLDDEGPAQASFESNAGTVTEGAEAVTVSILFSRAATTAGNLTVSYSPADAAITTGPAAAASKIIVPVTAGAEEVSFTVEPNEGAAAEGPLEITFTITGSTSDVEAAAGTSYVLTVEPVQVGEYTSIADLRAMYEGTAKKLTGPITIRGTVVSTNDNVTSKNVWVNDGEAGILLRFITDNKNLSTGESTLKLGDDIAVVLTDATLQEFSGTLQVGNNDLPNANATVLGTAALPAYKTISVVDLRTGNYEGQLVKIENVSFPEANGTAQLNNATNKGNNTFTTDGTNTGVLRVENYATFKGNPIPQGTGTIMGIASEFTSGGNTTYQVTPQTTADIFESHVAATITASKTSLTFGDVENGAESTVQSYTVSGTGLTTDLTITAPDHFLVSLSEGNGYAKIVSIPAGVANAGAITVYAKFSPTSGTNQTFTDKLVLASTAAANVEIAVTGNETGNDAPPALTIQINEFHYDNASTDANEFIEVMSTDVDLDVSNYQIILYNGNNGQSYGSISLSAITPVTANGRKYWVWDIPTATAFQNGAPDGMALVNGSAVIQFLSYEGTFAATNGAASGVTSVDVGVIEDGTANVPVGSSIQRKADGTWELTAGSNTKGATNVNE